MRVLWLIIMRNTWNAEFFLLGLIITRNDNKRQIYFTYSTLPIVSEVHQENGNLLQVIDLILPFCICSCKIRKSELTLGEQLIWKMAPPGGTAQPWRKERLWEGSCSTSDTTGQAHHPSPRAVAAVRPAGLRARAWAPVACLPLSGLSGILQSLFFTKVIPILSGFCED